MDYERLRQRARGRSRALKAVTYAFLTLWGVFVLFPFYWMVLTSLKSYSAYNGEFIPQLYTLAPTIQNYIEAFSAVPLGDYSSRCSRLRKSRDTHHTPAIATTV